MATCNVVQNIDRTECIGSSLNKINSNFTNLDLATCELTTYINQLETAVSSLSSALQSAVSQLGSIGSVPVGTVSAFVGITAPTGWLAANGQVVSVATYQALSDILYVGNSTNGTAAFGYRCTSQTSPASTRSTTGTFIVLPDLRDYFIRGLGGANSATYGRIQADDVKPHDHGIGNSTSGVTGAQSWPFIVDISARAGQYNQEKVRTTNSTGTETRPKNIPLLYCIKH